MKKFLLTASVVIAANVAMAQSAPATGASVSATAAPAKSWRDKMSFEAYYGVWGGVNAVNRGNNSGNGVDMYVQALRDIGKGQKLGLRVSGAQNQTNELANDKYETRLIDPQIMYKNPLNASTVRLSMPVTEVSREIGRYELRYNGGQDIVDAGRFTVGIGEELRGYAYSRDDAGQRFARARAILSPAYKLSDRLSVFSNMIYDVRWNKSGRGFTYLDAGADINDASTKSNPRNLDRRANLEAGFSITAIPDVLSVDAYVSQLQRVDDNNTAWKLFNEESTGYNLEFMIKM
jgi:hypothetical protein